MSKVIITIEDDADGTCELKVNFEPEYRPAVGAVTPSHRLGVRILNWVGGEAIPGYGVETTGIDKYGNHVTVTDDDGEAD